MGAVLRGRACPANQYPGARFADAASWLVDQERYAAFSADGAHHESRYYLTFLYLPPPEHEGRAERLLYERTETTAVEIEPHAQLEWFVTETDRAFQMLASILPETEVLGDAETLTYLHGVISNKHHPVAVPDIPTHLDAVICDTPFLGGVEPMLGDEHLRVLTVLGFPNITTPGLLDALNDLGFAYRWTTRWIALDKTEANRHLTRLRRQWFAKRKSVSAILREVMFNRETALVDPDADNKAADADEALQELGADDVAFGYLTTTVVVSDRDARQASEKLLAIERIINGRGFVTIRETLNAVEAWLGSLPGNPYANVRQPIVHTLNLAHMMPVSAVWAGPETNRHLEAPALMMAETRGSTPFRLDLHVGDVGHTLVVGPTGSGKSVLLSLLALQFRRFIGAQVILFDRGRSARAATLAMGGASIELGLEGTLSLQPLARIDEPGEIAFALQWVTALLTSEGVRVTPDVKDAVWTALQSLASAPRQERTLTGLAVLIQSNALVAALSPYTLEGAYGRLLDGASEELAKRRRAARRDGRADAAQGARPAGAHLSVPPAGGALRRTAHAAGPRRGLDLPRRRPVRGPHPRVAQDPAQEERGGRVRDPVAGRHRALDHRAGADRELSNAHLPAQRPRPGAAGQGCLRALRAQCAPDRDPEHGGAQARLLRPDRARQSPVRAGIRPVALALCGASAPEDHKIIDRCLAHSDKSGFAARFLEAKGLAWAGELIERWPADGDLATHPQ